VNSVLLVVKIEITVLPTILIVIGALVVTSKAVNVALDQVWNLGRNTVSMDVMNKNTVLLILITVLGTILIHLTIYIVIVLLSKDKKHGDNIVLSVVMTDFTVLLTIHTVTGLVSKTVKSVITTDNTMLSPCFLSFDNRTITMYIVRWISIVPSTVMSMSNTVFLFITSMLTVFLPRFHTWSRATLTAFEVTTKAPITIRMVGSTVISIFTTNNTEFTPCFHTCFHLTGTSSTDSLSTPGTEVMMSRTVFFVITTLSVTEILMSFLTCNNTARAIFLWFISRIRGSRCWIWV
jgi:hypothetical protein